MQRRSTRLRRSLRAGFTLFEIAVAMALVAVVIVAAFAAVPTGLRIQQHARFQMLASTKAMEVIEYFSGKSAGERIADFEAPEPWEARPFCYGSTRWDLEQRLMRWDSGVAPLPTRIARRLDSDADEIARLLDAGGNLYYADPRAVPGIDVRFLNPDPPNEAQKLVFGVVGYAQSDAIPVFPWKAWPYLAAYPSPPLSVEFDGGRFVPSLPQRAPQQLSWECIEGWSVGDADPMAPSARDPLIGKIFAACTDYFLTLRNQSLPPASRETTIAPLRDPLIAAVIAYCEAAYRGGRIVNPTGGLGGMSPDAEYVSYLRAETASDFVALGAEHDAAFADLCRSAEPIPGAAYDPARAKARAEIGLRVQCWRFLAFVAETFWQQRAGEPPTDLSGAHLDGIQLSVDRLRYWHDRCKAAAMRYAASFPYDWTAPRPVTRSLMTDCPLLEFDLFSPPRTGVLAGSGPAVPVAMWRPLSAQRIGGIGMPGTYPGLLTGGAFDATRSPFTPADDRVGGHPLWGDARAFTLCRSFAPTERCRELVFWSVDWQAYEDFELAPSAALDASRCPIVGLRADNIGGSYDGRLGMPLSIEDGFIIRNPERELAFGSDVSARATGADVRDAMLAGNGYYDYGGGTTTALLGVYGADRNHDFRLGRGPLSASVRQRAAVVARFPFYDPRLPINIR